MQRQITELGAIPQPPPGSKHGPNLTTTVSTLKFCFRTGPAANQTRNDLGKPFWEKRWAGGVVWFGCGFVGLVFLFFPQGEFISAHKCSQRFLENQIYHFISTVIRFALFKKAFKTYNVFERYHFKILFLCRPFSSYNEICHVFQLQLLTSK